MRIAVCITGLPNNWKTSYKNILKYFNMNGIKVDYFIHCLSDSDENDIKEIFHPVSILVEQYNSDNHFDILPLFYSFMKCIYLKRLYEIENDFLYDIVIRLGYDINFYQEGENQYEHPLNKFFIHNIEPLIAYNSNFDLSEKNSFKYNCNFFDDSIFYCDSLTMDIISNIYWWYKKILKKNLENKEKNYWLDNEFFYDIKSLYYKYLISKNIQMRSGNIPFYIVTKEADNMKLDSIKDWKLIKELSNNQINSN